MNETLLFTVLVLCILGVLSAVILYFVAQKFKVVEDPVSESSKACFPVPTAAAADFGLQGHGGCLGEKR